MLRYRLRTLLLLLAVLPPLLWFGWTKYEAWRVDQRRAALASETTMFELLDLLAPIEEDTGPALLGANAPSESPEYLGRHSLSR